MNEAAYRRWVRDLNSECDDAENAEPLTIHSFNPAIAVDYSIPAALVFEYVHDRCHKSGLKGVLTTIDMLASQHPYLGRSTLYHGLTALINGTKTCSSLIVRKHTRYGYLYCPLSPDMYDSQQPPHSFLVAIASQVGVIPAIVYNTAQRVSLNSQLVDPINAERRRTWRWLVGTCTKRLTYTSDRTILRALKSLVSGGMILRERGGRRLLWRVRETSTALN